MPQTHSRFYLERREESFSDWIRSGELPGEPDGTSTYDKLSDYLRECNDACFGIVSKLNEHGEWVRDATAAIPLDKRMPHNAPLIEANNALLRCLSRLRPIDYAIARQLGQTQPVNAFRMGLKNRFADLVTGINNIVRNADFDDEEKRQAISRAEECFNDTLVQALHWANLTEGCDTRKDAERLLFHYRNLSSLMVPARPLITLTHDVEAHVFQRETQYPVTKKTDKQIEAVAALRTITYPQDEFVENSHNIRSVAEQNADRLFADLIAADDRALPAQARKTHLVGIKNAYVVKNELFFDVAPDEHLHLTQALPKNTLWLARTGSPAYVGRGETPDAIRFHTKENLEQIRLTATRLMIMPTRVPISYGDDDNVDSDTEFRNIASGSNPVIPFDGDDFDPDTMRDYLTSQDIDNFQRPLSLHIACLNTNTKLQHQATIVHSIQDAMARAEGDGMSYLPTNAHGLVSSVKLSKKLHYERDQDKPRGRAPLLKARRLEAVAGVMLEAASLPKTLSVVNCASGQDRTGTAIEKATQMWMAKRYEDSDLDPRTIDAMRALGGNAAEITTHHVHGSPGMKDDSRANNTLGDKRTFSTEADAQYYLDSAGTNKKNKVGKITFLNQAGPVALADYQDRLKRYTQAVQGLLPDVNPAQQQLYLCAKRLLDAVREIAGEYPGRLDLDSLSQLNQVLYCATVAMENPDNAGNNQRLNDLSHVVSGRASPGWRALGVALMALAALTLVVAVPVLSATGVGTVIAVGVGAGAFALGYAGLAFFKRSGQTGLSKSVSKLHAQLTKHVERESDDENLDSASLLNGQG